MPSRYLELVKMKALEELQKVKKLNAIGLTAEPNLFNIIEKELKALNIFRKAFEEHLFYLCDYSNACGECYILMIDADEGSRIELTKQEYDLLKEVLGDE